MKKKELEKIRIQRAIKGYSQEYIAQKLEITQSQYSRLESGLNKISEKHIGKIHGILEIEESTLPE